MRKKLGELLVEAGAVTTADVQAALAAQKGGGAGLRIGELLVQMRRATPVALAKALAIQFELPFVELPQIGSDVSAIIPVDFQAEHKIVPFRLDVDGRQQRLHIALADPAKMDVVEDLRFQINKPLKTYIAALDDLDGAIAALRGEAVLEPELEDEEDAEVALEVAPEPVQEAKPVEAPAASDWDVDVAGAVSSPPAAAPAEWGDSGAGEAVPVLAAEWDVGETAVASVPNEWDVGSAATPEWGADGSETGAPPESASASGAGVAAVALEMEQLLAAPPIASRGSGASPHERLASLGAKASHRADALEAPEAEGELQLETHRFDSSPTVARRDSSTGPGSLSVSAVNGRVGQQVPEAASGNGREASVEASAGSVAAANGRAAHASAVPALATLFPSPAAANGRPAEVSAVAPPTLSASPTAANGRAAHVSNVAPPTLSPPAPTAAFGRGTHVSTEAPPSPTPAAANGRAAPVPDVAAPGRSDSGAAPAPMLWPAAAEAGPGHASPVLGPPGTPAAPAVASLPASAFVLPPAPSRASSANGGVGLTTSGAALSLAPLPVGPAPQVTVKVMASGAGAMAMGPSPAARDVPESADAIPVFAPRPAVEPKLDLSDDELDAATSSFAAEAAPVPAPSEPVAPANSELSEEDLKVLESLDQMAQGLEPTSPSQKVKPAQMVASLIRLLIRKGVIQELDFLEELGRK